MDLQQLSLDELKSLRRDVEKAIASFEERQRKAALAEVEAVAAKHGFTLDILTGKKSAKKVHPPRYAHPEDTTKTWSGRGRQPQWIKDALAEIAPRWALGRCGQSSCASVEPIPTGTMWLCVLCATTCSIDSKSGPARAGLVHRKGSICC